MVCATQVQGGVAFRILKYLCESRSRIGTFYPYYRHGGITISAINIRLAKAAAHRLVNAGPTSQTLDRHSPDDGPDYTTYRYRDDIWMIQKLATPRDWGTKTSPVGWKGVSVPVYSRGRGGFVLCGGLRGARTMRHNTERDSEMSLLTSSSYYDDGIERWKHLWDSSLQLLTILEICLIHI